jgi:RHS repeat-associated protein
VQRDSLKQLSHRSRDLHAGIGVWLQRDLSSGSFGFSDIASEVELLSSYQYVAGNPVSYTDPHGQFIFKIWDWFRFCRQAYSCNEFTKEYTALKKECEVSIGGDVDEMIYWQGQCPNQISPIINPGELAHSVICCVLAKAKEKGIDMKWFGEGFVFCLKIIKTPNILPSPDWKSLE